MARCYQIHEASIVEAVKQLTQLKHISLKYSTTSVVFNFDFDQLLSLQFCSECNQLRNKTLSTLAHFCTQLESLEMSW